jgi:hypothetical protein
MLLGALPLAGAGAQAPTGRIAGAVRDVATGKPLPNAVVVVSKPGDTFALRQVRTDSAGRFAVDSLTPARYRLQAAHPRLDAHEVRSLDFVVAVRRGGTTHATLGGLQPPNSSGDPSCSDGIETHPGGIEMTGLSRPVGGGAASAAVLRPGEQGTNTQYTLVDGCRKAPLSERAAPPQR